MNFNMNSMGKRETPSLLSLCIKQAIDYVRYLGDVGETEIDLLGQILPHCTIDQLMHIENSTKGRDLSEVTDKLWKFFYEKEFGFKSTSIVEERMKSKRVLFKWRYLYKAKLKERDEATERIIDKVKLMYKKEDIRKQSRQVQICTKVPPGSKRSFFGGSGPGHNVSNLKSNLMKKAKIECLNSREVKNIAAMKKNVIQKSHSASSSMKIGIPRKDIASSSSSKLMKPNERRF